MMAEKILADQLIPILIAIDAEPDGTFIDPKQKMAWHGFEHSEAVIERWREVMERTTGREVHITWLLRMDPHIEKVYGSLQWSVENYAGRLERIAQQGDEIGLHSSLCGAGFSIDCAAATTTIRVRQNCCSASERRRSGPLSTEARTGNVHD